VEFPSESSDQSFPLFSEEELDPAPRACIRPSPGHIPIPHAKPQAIKPSPKPQLISSFFSANRDQFGNQIPEESQDQLEAIKEENQHQSARVQTIL
jgi:hypothetical protein